MMCWFYPFLFIFILLVEHFYCKYFLIWEHHTPYNGHVELYKCTFCCWPSSLTWNIDWSWKCICLDPNVHNYFFKWKQTIGLQVPTVFHVHRNILRNYIQIKAQKIKWNCWIKHWRFNNQPWKRFGIEREKLHFLMMIWIKWNQKIHSITFKSRQSWHWYSCWQGWILSTNIQNPQMVPCMPSKLLTR